VVRLRVLFVVLSGCAVLAACGESCDHAVLSEVTSPDRKLKAVVFQRGCGTGIDSSTQVSILGSEALPRDRGNAFITGDDKRETPPDKKPPGEIKAVWESNSSLTIS